MTTEPAITAPSRRQPRFLDLDAPWITTIDPYTQAHDLVIPWIWEVDDLTTPRGEPGEPCPTVFRTMEPDLTYEEALGILLAARADLSESARKHGRRIIKRHYRAFLASREAARVTGGVTGGVA